MRGSELPKRKLQLGSENDSAAGCPVPTDDACVSETVAGIRRDAAGKGQSPEKKVAATAAIIQQLLAPIPDDLRGKRDRALLLVGFAGALRLSELAAIRVERLEKTDRGLRLTIPQTKGSQTDSVVVPLPYGQTELCPVRALNAWLAAAGITGGPVFRRIWLPASGKRRTRGKQRSRGELPANGGHAGQSAEDAPLPSPRLAKRRSRRARLPTSSRRAPSPPVLPGATSPATASSAAR
jgi:integrase